MNLPNFTADLVPKRYGCLPIGPGFSQYPDYTPPNFNEEQTEAPPETVLEMIEMGFFKECTMSQLMALFWQIRTWSYGVTFVWTQLEEGVLVSKTRSIAGVFSGFSVDGEGNPLYPPPPIGSPHLLACDDEYETGGFYGEADAPEGTIYDLAFTPLAHNFLGLGLNDAGGKSPPVAFSYGDKTFLSCIFYLNASPGVAGNQSQIYSVNDGGGVAISSKISGSFTLDFSNGKTLAWDVYGYGFDSVVATVKAEELFLYN